MGAQVGVRAYQYQAMQLIEYQISFKDNKPQVSTQHFQLVTEYLTPTPCMWNTSLFCIVFPYKSTHALVLGDSFFVRHVMGNHVGTSSLYKTLSHIKMFEVEKKKSQRQRERERANDLVDEMSKPLHL